jgi:hypothetical protein
MAIYRIQTQEENGLWHDVKGSDGKPLLFESMEQAHAALDQMFPVLVKMQHYGGTKRTRAYEVLKDEDDK